MYARPTPCRSFLRSVFCRRGVVLLLSAAMTAAINEIKKGKGKTDRTSRQTQAGTDVDREGQNL